MSRALVIDTETTGIVDAVACEVAWAEFDFERRTTGDADCVRLNPGKPISFAAMAVHHITDADVADRNPASDYRLPDCDYIIGHNVDFDWVVLGKPDVKRICTLALSRSLFEDDLGHTLGAMMYRLFPASEAREWTKNAHSAMDDVLMCLELFAQLCSRLQPTSFDDVWQMSEQARVPKLMPFGKHKGTPVGQVPADYKRWLSNQQDVDPYLLKALGIRGVKP